MAVNYAAGVKHPQSLLPASLRVFVSFLVYHANICEGQKKLFPAPELSKGESKVMIYADAELSVALRIAPLFAYRFVKIGYFLLDLAC